MKIILPAILGLACLLSGCMTSRTEKPEPENAMIVHSVFFKLKHDAGSKAEADFMAQACELAAIPGVENFQALEEVSPKNDFDFGLTMQFADQAAYDGYSNHPDHTRFVQEVWLKEVSDFQEIDYVPHKK
jgi:hypothetical protein